MSDDDLPTEHADKTLTSDSAEAVADGGTVANETPQSRFWGTVPPGWDLVEGTDVYDVNPSYTPEEEEITYIEMDALDTELPFPKYSKKRKAADYSGKLFCEGDTLFARITPCTENGKTAFVSEMETDVGIGSTEYAVLSPDRTRIHPLYLYYVAKSHPVRNYAISRMRGSTGRQRVPFDVFRRELNLSLPQLKEQKRIVSVLFNLDQLIQNTQDIIKKLERLDQGLLQKVFTNGLRGSSTKETGTLGHIPIDWDVKELSEVANITMGTSPKSEYYNTEGEGLPFFQANNEFGIRSPTHDRWCSSPVKTATAGDILMTIRGTYVGQVNVADIECCIGRGLAGITPDSEHVIGEYLYHHLRYRERYIKSVATGSTFDSVSTSELEPLPVAVPSMETQEEIGELFRTHQEEYLHLHDYKSELIHVKKGLLQDLMTGDVRTADAAIEIINKVIEHE